MGGYALLTGQWSGFLADLPEIGAFGFVMGGAFGGLLAFTERRRSLQDLSIPRVALWGAVGGFLAVGVFSMWLGFPPWGIVSGFTALSAVFAAGHVSLAKQADRAMIQGDDAALFLEGE
jgi:hypothetical protein